MQIGAHSGWCINITALVFENQTPYGNIIFPLASALLCLVFMSVFFCRPCHLIDWCNLNIDQTLATRTIYRNDQSPGLTDTTQGFSKVTHETNNTAERNCDCVTAKHQHMDIYYHPTRYYCLEK